jgi:hypothetical protein
MKLKDKNGRILETENQFVIDQLIKYGAVEIKSEPPKTKETRKGG